MNTTVLLVLLTLKGTAPLGVNFVNFDSLPPCQARAAQLQEILTKGGIKVVEDRCVASFQHFSKHRHRKSKGDHGRKVNVQKKNVFLIALNDARTLVIPQQDLQSCTTEKARREKAGKGRTRFYCALSEQRLLCDAEVAEMKRKMKK